MEPQSPPPELVGNLLKRTRPDLVVSKYRLRQAEGVQLIKMRREQANQNLAFSSRPFVLCGLPVRRPPNGQLLYERRNGKFTLQLTGHPDFGLPFGQDRLVPIFLATLAVRQQSQTIRFKTAAEMLDTFGMAKGGKEYRRLVGAFERIFGATIFFGTDTMRSTARVVHLARFNFFRSAQIWYNRDADQRVLRDELENVITLSDEFYNEIVAHPNRANGELGIMAAVQGNTSSGVIMIGNALKTARDTGDLASQVRWYSIMGMGFVQFGRYEEALKLFDRAFDAGRSVEELQFPAMTCLGKANALVKLKRFKEATGLLDEALSMAQRRGSLGYQAELLKNAGMIANEIGDRDDAIAKLEEAADYAQRANANRILAEIYLELGKMQQQAGHPQAAAKTLQQGISIARQMRERFLLPRLLNQSAQIAAQQGRIAEASGLLEEATDVLEGLLVGATSPWLKSRLIGVMDEVFVARIRLEAEHGRDPRKIFAFVEQARGRVLADLLIAGPAQNPNGPWASSAGEKELSKLQARLWTAKGRSERKAVLDRILLLESDMAPASAQAFQRSQAGSPRRPMTLPEFQRILRPDEILLEFVLLEPASYCLVVTRETAAVRTLPGRASTGGQARTLLKDVREGKPVDTAAHSLGAALLGGIPELARKQRLIVVPDGELHRVPFELLSLDNAEMLLRSHVITYAPSASALALLRRKVSQPPSLMALAVSASPDAPQLLTAAQPAPFGSISRGVYDLDGASLPLLPSANDEARAVVAILCNSSSKLLLGDEATEQNLKRQPLKDYDVLHFAVHGLVSTKFPERSALVLRYKPDGGEDSLLQAREILSLRLNADLVTLSACETGSGALFGQEGVSNLVRPFLAAGARSVAANLWAADDTFSLALMREFYRQLAAGKETAVALQQAKLAILTQFGSEALPRFWSGLILYGDGARTIRIRP